MGKDKKTNENTDINTEIKKAKKKVFIIMGTLLIVVIGVAGFFGYKAISSSNAEKAKIQKELEAMDLKDYPVDASEENKIYSRDLAKQTYVLKDGAILFEGTLIFHNKLCANLYNGITDRKEQAETEPDLTLEGVFGEKLAKDALNKYLQEHSKSELSSSAAISEGIKEAINEEFKNTFGHEVIKQVLVTNHIVQ